MYAELTKLHLVLYLHVMGNQILRTNSETCNCFLTSLSIVHFIIQVLQCPLGQETLNWHRPYSLRCVGTVLEKTNGALTNRKPSSWRDSQASLHSIHVSRGRSTTRNFVTIQTTRRLALALSHCESVRPHLGTNPVICSRSPPHPGLTSPTPEGIYSDAHPLWDVYNLSTPLAFSVRQTVVCVVPSPLWISINCHVTSFSAGGMNQCLR